MSLSSSSFEPYLSALSLTYGTLGLYSISQRIFLTFGILAGPAVCVIGASFWVPRSAKVKEGELTVRNERADAPFGRFVPKRWKVNGTVGWLVMEIVSPLMFLTSLSTPLSNSLNSFVPPSFSLLFSTISNLSSARKLLVGCYLVHYLNRAVLSSLWRNPGRASMHIAVPLAAIVFNSLNGFLMGTYIGDGSAGSSSFVDNYEGKEGIIGGVQQGKEFYFLLSLLLWTLGFLSNIYSDEVLYSLKRSSLSKIPSSTPNPKHHYSIPHGFLYSYPLGGISNPSYFVEWGEWIGYLLACGCLTGRGNWIGGFGGGKWGEGLPGESKVLEGWWVSPPALFLWNELLTMFPRAISGHRWYKKTFGDEFPKERKAVIPGLI